MELFIVVLGFFCLLLNVSPSSSAFKHSHANINKDHFHDKLPKDQWSNSWVVEIEGGMEKANEIANNHGVTNFGQIGSLANMYTFVKTVPSQQPGRSLYRVYSSADAAKDDYETNLYNDPEIKFVTHQQIQKHVKKDIPLAEGNPLWNLQWYLKNTGQADPTAPLIDINVEGAWELGYTGQGVLVGVVDDGVDGSHTDLQRNYNSENSYDFIDDDDDATPEGNSSDHGTACAGEIAMEISNDVCGVGVAYNSQLSGLRILGDEALLASQEASALTHRFNAIDIYSNSWGPPDTGYIVSGPEQVVQMALAAAAKEGRNGLGNIYTWAAGNGGFLNDSCAADGFVNSIYTISVGAYNQVSTALNNECTLTFSGTSAATPLVSGVISLALEANPQLTWRDVQYLIVNTSNSEVLLDNTEDYFTNGAGLTVSHSFGFGAIDAEAMVTRAKQWETVPPQISNTVIPSINSGECNSSKPFISTVMYSGDIRYMEHLVVTMTLDVSSVTESVDYYQAYNLLIDFYYDLFGISNFNGTAHIAKRGDFEVSITSPSNTKSTLLFPRSLDTITTQGYDQWPFLSVLHWGENPNGEWTINVSWNNPDGLGAGTIQDVSVEFYGVSSFDESPSESPSESTSSESPSSESPSSESPSSESPSSESPSSESPSSESTSSESPSSAQAIQGMGILLLFIIAGLFSFLVM